MYRRYTHTLFKGICLITLLSFTGVMTIPATAAAVPSAVSEDNNIQRLQDVVYAVAGEVSPEQVLDVITLTMPVPEAYEDEMLAAIDGMLVGPIDDPRSEECSNAIVLFFNGLTLVLVSVILSEVVTQETCTSEECIGDLCVCFQEETTSPLSGVNKILRAAGNVMMGLGIVGYVQNCLLAPVTE